MHTALWKLYRLRTRGSLRSMAAKVKTLRGAALAVFTLLVLGMMLGPNLAMAFKLSHSGAPVQGAAAFREIIPVAMLALVVMTVVTSLGERALYFSPSDVDFLFPAPFSRRQILVYKILGNITAAIYVALIVPISLAIHVRSWPAAMVGCFLAWLMINSLVMCAQLVAQSVGERAFTRARRLLLGVLIVAAAVALGQVAGRGLDGPWQETLLEARHSPAAEILLAPFTVFASIITAEQLIPDALGWAALGTVMVAGVYALAIRLDANYLETAARVSQKIQERRRRAASGGILALRSGQVQSTRLPQPPWLGGVGPLLWRQAIQFLRGSRSLMLLALIVTAAFGTPLVFAARGQHELPPFLPHILVGAAAYITFLISAHGPFGFQGDYERMDLLKSLPIRPMAMACGATLAGTLLLGLLQWSVFAATAVFMPAAAAEIFIAGLFALPFNWILCGTENFLFLLYPSPRIATGSEGFLKMGRVVLFMLAKFLVLGVCGAVAAVPATVVYLVTRSALATWLAGWAASLLPAAGILLLVAWAFRRYDVSVGAAE